MKKIEKEDVRILEIAANVLDSFTGKAGITEEPLDCGSSMYELIQGYAHRILTSDKVKTGFFLEGSEAGEMLKRYQDKDFMEAGQMLAGMLFAIMQGNADIPPAYLYVVRFKTAEKDYLGIFKVNYKDSRRLRVVDGQPQMEIIRGSMPKNATLAEAAAIDLDSMKIRLTEKKYEVNGIKSNYFSEYFLKCGTKPSEENKLKVVLNAVDNCAEGDGTKEPYAVLQRKIAVRETMRKLLEEDGKIKICEVCSCMAEREKEEFKKRMEQRGLWDEEIEPIQEGTTKKLRETRIKTWGGIDIRVPEEYADKMQISVQENDQMEIRIKNLEGLFAI